MFAEQGQAGIGRSGIRSAVHQTKLCEPSAHSPWNVIDVPKREFPKGGLFIDCERIPHDHSARFLLS